MPRQPQPRIADMEDEDEFEIEVEPIERNENFEFPQIDMEVDGGNVQVNRLVLSPELAAIAIYEARGMASVAARKLGVTVRVINRYMKDYDICRVAKEEAETMLLDFAEAKLMQKIRSGDIASIIFFLRTKGKSRGYTEKEIDKADQDARLQEEAQREARERETEIMNRLEEIGTRLRTVGDIEIDQPAYVNGTAPQGEEDNDRTDSA